MRSLIFIGLAAALALGGCTAQEVVSGPSSNPGHRGRFSSVGIYTPGRMWAQLAPPTGPRDAPPPAPAAAQPDDDEQVIVVLDSITGEVSQCGNLSGRCIAMNPWNRPAVAPAQLLKHAQQLREAAASPPRRTRSPPR